MKADQHENNDDRQIAGQCVDSVISKPMYQPKSFELRDRFACVALEGILAGWLSRSSPYSLDAIASDAYEAADAMLAERVK